MYPYDLTRHAKMLVADYINKKNESVHEIDPIKLSELSIVWFSKTINTWTAFIATNIPNGIYYEVGSVSYESDIYLKEYQMTNSIIINDIESEIQ